MPSDARPYITVANDFPEHPKTLELSDAAFRAVVELWCYCNRNLTDGRVPTALLRRYKPATIRELVRVGFMEQDDDGHAMHDYLEHQKSRDQVAEHRAKRAESGAYGMHVRHHEKKGVKSQTCGYCARS